MQTWVKIEQKKQTKPHPTWVSNHNTFILFQKRAAGSVTPSPPLLCLSHTPPLPLNYINHILGHWARPHNSFYWPRSPSASRPPGQHILVRTAATMRASVRMQHLSFLLLWNQRNTEVTKLSLLKLFSSHLFLSFMSHLFWGRWINIS